MEFTPKRDPTPGELLNEFIVGGAGGLLLSHTQVGVAGLNFLTRDADLNKYEMARTYRGHRWKAVFLQPYRNAREMWHQSSVPTKFVHALQLSGALLANAAVFVAYAYASYRGYPEILALPVLTNAYSAYQQHQVNKRSAEFIRTFKAKNPAFNKEPEIQVNEDNSAGLR